MTNANERERTPPAARAAMLPLAWGLLLFVPIVLAGNGISLALRYPDIGSAVLFPPYAALTAALVVSRRRDWIWYLLVGSLAHLLAHWPHWSLSWVLLADVANIARALTAAALLRWLFGGLPRLDSIRALSLFVLSAVVAAPAVGATIGAANVVLHGASDVYWRPWSAWFVSNALTGLTMLPGLLPAFAYTAGLRRIHFDRKQAAEALLLAIALGIVCRIAFLDNPDARYLALPLYAPLPVLIWAALRFGSGGASLAQTVVAFAAILSVDRGTGPFLVTPPDDNIFALQIFVLLISLPVLCLAVTATARKAVVQLYRALLASLQDHVAILDANGIVLEVNDSWRRYAETSKAPGFQCVRAGDPYLAACRCAAEQGDATAAGVLAGVTSVLGRARQRYEIEYEQDRDSRREVYVMSVEALARSGGGAVVTRSDVTARRQAQMKIEEQRRELSHLARVAVLGQLSGAIAHEINQPLTAILSNAEAARYLLRSQPADLGQLDDIMQDIADDDQRAAAVIQRLRALLKRGEKQFQAIDGIELVGEVLELAHTELIQRQVKATAAVATAQLLFFGDRVQMQQVLLNLILNGCEAMSSTAPSDRRLVLTAGADPAGNVHLAVRDCGPGIPSELIECLFEPFVTTKPEGLGLGLSISQTIVAAHGGRLWAENNAEGGATLHCLLPVLDPSHPAQHPRSLPLLGAAHGS